MKRLSILFTLLCISLLSVSCSSIDNYRIDHPEKKLSKIKTEIQNSITQKKINEEKIEHEKKYKVELLNVYVSDVIKSVFGELLNLPFAISDSVYNNEKKIDVVIKNKISSKEIVNIIKRALNVSGVSVEYIEGCYYFSQIQPAGDFSGKSTKGIELKNLVVYQLKNKKSDAIIKRFEVIRNEYPDLRLIGDDQAEYLIFSCNEYNRERIIEILNDLDTIEKQVYIEVNVIESNREGALKNGLAGYIKMVYEGLNFSITPINFISDLTNFSIVKDVDTFNMILGILQTENILYRINAPYLIIKNNTSAQLNVGDRIPILEKTIKTNESTDTSIIYRNTGFDINIKPEIIGNNININLEIEISSGEINKLSDINSPSISSRLIKSSFICPNNQAILIGGIYQKKSVFKNSGLPGNNKIIKNYVNYNDRINDEIELSFFIRPVIINEDYYKNE